MAAKRSAEPTSSRKHIRWPSVLTISFADLRRALLSASVSGDAVSRTYIQRQRPTCQRPTGPVPKCPGPTIKTWLNPTFPSRRKPNAGHEKSNVGRGLPFCPFLYSRRPRIGRSIEHPSKDLGLL